MDRVARVLFVIDELDVGGTEQQLLELVKRLDRRRYAPMVCCFRPGRVSREIGALGVPVVTIRKRWKVDPFLVLSLTRLMRRERIDLVQTYLFTSNTWARLAAILARVPVIVSSERNVDIWEPAFKRRLGCWLDRWTAVTIVNSEAVKDYLSLKGLPRKKLRVIYNGVDPERFEPSATPETIRTELGIPADHAVVGLVARLEPQKDPHTFLRAAAIVAAKCPAVSFLVVGGGTLERELPGLARELGIADRVIFTGPRRDVPELLAGCDVSVISSLKEGMSNSVMESMAAGKPMVATRVGGNAELIQNGETGLLIPPGDPSSLAGAIQRLLDNASLAQAMGRRAKIRMAERFSVDAMVEAIQWLYAHLLRPKPASRRGDETAARRGDDANRLGLVVSQFPRYVDAYFLREISALASRGIRFRIFSLRGFDGAVVHAAAKPFLPDTVYVPFLFSWPLARAHARFLYQMPLRYLGTLATVIGGTLRQPRALVRSLAVFPKSVYLAELVRTEGIAHVHANWASHPATSALVIARLTGISWSFTGHASDIYIDNAMLPEKLRAAEFVVTCTSHNQGYLARAAGLTTADKIVVSYHGVDLARFAPPAQRPVDRFRILTAGTLRECKGFPDLVEACRLLAGRAIAFDCTIVGDGEERAGLERLIRRLGLQDRVRITGYLSQEDLIPLYQQASVVALPALSESHFGIPNVLVEALAVETPIVCTRLPSLSELMEDGECGLYVPERDPGALANALEQLARDPARCRAMGAAGRRKITTLFDAEKNTAALEALFASRAAPVRVDGSPSRSGLAVASRSRSEDRDA